MKLTKEQVCVYISNKAQLQEARELLEKYGEDYHFIWEKEEDNFLCLSGSHSWGVYGYSLERETQITLSELETILKEQ